MISLRAKSYVQPYALKWGYRQRRARERLVRGMWIKKAIFCRGAHTWQAAAESLEDYKERKEQESRDIGWLRQ